MSNASNFLDWTFRRRRMGDARGRDPSRVAVAAGAALTCFWFEHSTPSSTFIFDRLDKSGHGAASYGAEIWTLFESGRLHVDAELTGRIEVDTRALDLDGVMQELGNRARFPPKIPRS